MNLRSFLKTVALAIPFGSIAARAPSAPMRLKRWCDDPKHDIIEYDPDVFAIKKDPMWLSDKPRTIVIEATAFNKAELEDYLANGWEYVSSPSPGFHDLRKRFTACPFPPFSVKENEA